MIQARGSRITMHDVGGVLEPLARCLDHAGRILHITAGRLQNSEPLLAMAIHSERTRDALKEVVRHRGRIMTIGPPDCDLIGQADQLRGAMRSLHQFVSAIDGPATPGPARVSHEIISRSWRIIRELHRSVGAAGVAGQLFVVRHSVTPHERTWAPAPRRDSRIIDLLESLDSAATLGVLPTSTRRLSARTLGLRFHDEEQPAGVPRLAIDPRRVGRSSVRCGIRKGTDLVTALDIDDDRDHRTASAVAVLMRGRPEHDEPSYLNCCGSFTDLHANAVSPFRRMPAL